MITQTKLAAVKDTLSTTQNELDTLKASLPAKEYELDEHEGSARRDGS